MFSCSWFDKITNNLYLLISNFRLTLSSNGIPFLSVNDMIMSLNSVYYMFPKTLDLFGVNAYSTSDFR